MKVYRADTGEVYVVDSSSNSTVASVKSELAGLTGVEAADQILLFDKYRLDDTLTLAAYNLPSEDKPVFLFNRKHLTPGAPPPKETVLGPIEARVPPEPAEPHAAGVIGALLKYQHQFLGHLKFAKAVLVAVDSRLALSRQCFVEQEMQAQALDAAIAHLKDHLLSVLRKFENLREYYVRQKGKHDSLLESFETDLARLREVALSPALRNGGMQTLADAVPEARLRKWAGECQSNAEQLSLRVSEVEQKIVEAQRQLESLTARLDVRCPEELKEGLKSTGAMRQEVVLTKASFSKDYKSVTARIEDLHRGKGEGSWEVCDGFDSMKTVHLKQLDRLTRINSASAKAMSACAESKTKVAITVHITMQHVAVLETRVQEIFNHLHVTREIIVQQQQAFSQLFCVRYLPEAYRAALEEVGRRKIFGSQITNLLAQFCHRLAKIREDELKQRELFLTKYGRYIPRSLIPGLPDELPDFVNAINRAFPLAKLDRNLPAIEPLTDAPYNLSLTGSIGELVASPPKLSPRGSSGTVAVRPSSDVLGRLSALEAENARLTTELARREKEAREREREWEEKQRQQRTKDSREREEEAAVYRSPYSSPGSSLSPSSSTSVSGAERKRIEESYQQRIMSLEEKLASTFGHASNAESAREAEEKRAAAAEHNLSMMRKTMALMQDKLKDQEALRSECDDLRERLNKLTEENRLLINNLRETHDSIIEEQKDSQKRKESELDATKTTIQLQERISALEGEKIVLKEELEAARSRAADNEEAHERSLNECQGREEALKAGAQETLERLELTMHEKDDLNSQLAIVRDELARAQTTLNEREQAVQELAQKLKQTEEEKEALVEASRVADETQTRRINELEEQTRFLKQTLTVREEELENKIGEQVEKEVEIANLRAALKKEEELRHKSFQEKDAQLQDNQHEIVRLGEAVAKAEDTVRAREEKIAQIQQLLNDERQSHQAVVDEKEALEAELTVKLADGMSESNELNMQLVKLHAQLVRKDSQIAETKSELERSLTELEKALEKERESVAPLKESLEKKTEEIGNLEQTLNLLREESEQTKKTLEDQIAELNYRNKRMLAITNFKVDDLALFLPERGSFAALNKGFPNYYVSPESLELRPNKRESFILGQIIFITDFVAESSNPYKLPAGTPYHEVTITEPDVF